MRPKLIELIKLHLNQIDAASLEKGIDIDIAWMLRIKNELRYRYSDLTWPQVVIDLPKNVARVRNHGHIGWHNPILRGRAPSQAYDTLRPAGVAEW